MEFRALLYVPDKAPYNFMNDYYSHKASLKLYVRRVFISDDFEELIPRCVRLRACAAPVAAPAKGQLAAAPPAHGMPVTPACRAEAKILMPLLMRTSASCTVWLQVGDHCAPGSDLCLLSKANPRGLPALGPVLKVPLLRLNSNHLTVCVIDAGTCPS